MALCHKGGTRAGAAIKSKTKWALALVNVPKPLWFLQVESFSIFINLKEGNIQRLKSIAEFFSLFYIYIVAAFHPVASIYAKNLRPGLRPLAAP